MEIIRMIFIKLGLLKYYYYELILCFHFRFCNYFSILYGVGRQAHSTEVLQFISYHDITITTSSLPFTSYQDIKITTAYIETDIEENAVCRKWICFFFSLKPPLTSGFHSPSKDYIQKNTKDYVHKFEWPTVQGHLFNLLPIGVSTTNQAALSFRLLTLAN